jgi:HAD superfamily hydrolase (TIGR01509 family)
MTKRITTLTFDLWNTLYSDTGVASGLVKPRRLGLLTELLESRGIHPSEDELQRAYHAGFEEYMAAWTSGRHFGAREDLRFVLEYFHAPDAQTEAERDLFEQIVTAMEDALYLAPPDLLPGVRETIPALAVAGYRLGIISDTSLTPGRVLKDFLKKDGLLGCFSTFTFSDETGFPKPDPRMFEVTLAGLGARPSEAAHIGDTPRTDIAGARALGMTTIRCAGTADHPEPPEADFVIRDHRELPAILERLEG